MRVYGPPQPRREILTDRFTTSESSHRTCGAPIPVDVLSKESLKRPSNMAGTNIHPYTAGGWNVGWNGVGWGGMEWGGVGRDGMETNWNQLERGRGERGTACPLCQWSVRPLAMIASLNS